MVSYNKDQLTPKNVGSLIVWMGSLIGIGFFIGSLTKSEVGTWYETLNRSGLTPPNGLFGIVWTILYAAMGACGWSIWQAPPFPKRNSLKSLYAMGLILNWSWTPLFFYYHLTGVSLLVLGGMDILVGMLIIQAYPKLKLVSVLMTPYLAWLLFASYLNFYIWEYN